MCSAGSITKVNLSVPLALPVRFWALCGFSPMKDIHRKKIRRFENIRHLYELTFSCYKRMPLLTNDPWRGILAASLNTACREESFDLIAFVFMPEHVHLLVLPLTSGSSLRDIVDPDLPV